MPDAQTIAEGAPLDVDISHVQEGQQILVKWRGHPIFVVKRPKKALDELKNQELLAKLSDPDSKVIQQPPYARTGIGR